MHTKPRFTGIAINVPLFVLVGFNRSMIRGTFKPPGFFIDAGLHQKISERNVILAKTELLDVPGANMKGAAISRLVGIFVGTPCLHGRASEYIGVG